MNSARRSKKLLSKEFTRVEDNSIWKVEDWKSFEATFDPIGENEIGEFDNWAKQHETQYLCARMRFCIVPMVAPLSTDAESLRPQTYAEIAARLQTSEEQVEFHIDMLKITWRRYVKERAVFVPKLKVPDGPPPNLQNVPPAPVSTPSQSKAVQPSVDELSECATIIEAFQFDMFMFDVPGRDDKVKHIEIAWFAGRLSELKKMFEEPMAKTMARQALMNELQLRRADQELSRIPTRSNDFWNIHDKKVKLEERYEAQWKQLEEICPYIKGALQKQGVHACVSALISAHRQWVANGNRVLIDDVFTSLEIQVLMRASTQSPEPMYRPGWVLAVKEAKEHLNNPAYARLLPDVYFKILDDGLKKSWEMAVDRGLVKLVDLEDTGPKGEWPPMYVAPADAIKPLVDKQLEVATIEEDLPDVQPALE